MVITTVLVIATCVVSLTSGAPTRVDRAITDLQNEIYGILNRICAAKTCLFGQASFDVSIGACACPEWPTHALTGPCGALECDTGKDPFYSVIADACYCGTMDEWYSALDSNSLPPDEAKDGKELSLELRRRQTPAQSEAPVNTPTPDSTFIPPPKPDDTAALINQSLTVQPQNSATVSSIIPHFLDGVFQVYLQLNGPVPETLVVNCSTSLPCGTIGLVDPQPDVALVPKFVQQGQGQPTVSIADCECIAVNIYTTGTITFWIQKLNGGAVYSVVGENQVQDIDKMDLSQEAALTLATLTGNHTKRNPADAIDHIRPERRQIFSVDCGRPCPFYHMQVIKGSDGYCGCMFLSPDAGIDARGIAAPDVHTATMTPEACEAMTCFNNGGSDPTPPMFNPFQRTCWCMSRPPIESNPNSWSESV